MDSGYALRFFEKPDSCDFCRLRHLCLPKSLTPDQVRQLDHLAKHPSVFTKHQRIYAQNSTFSFCYAVKSGSVKTVHVDALGHEQVLGFYLPGELFGFDGICSNMHSCSAVALERSLICRINFHELEDEIQRLPGLQHAVFQLMARELNTTQNLVRYLTQSTAEERLIQFLVNLSNSYKRRGLSETVLQLPMTRGDIASYLGLAIETVSRILSRLQRERLIELKGRQIAILEFPALQTMLPAE